MLKKETIESQLLNKGYSEKTAELYSIQVLKLQKHYTGSDLNDLSFDDIKDYMSVLHKRKNYSGSTQIHARRALEFYYNTVLKRNFDFNEIKIERTYSRNSIDFFSKSEILDIISSSNTFKTRMILTLAYGCGLDVGEVSKIKKADIDFNNKTLKVFYKKGRKSRFAVLPNGSIEDIKLYLEEYKPKKYVFEGKTQGKSISTNAVQWNYKVTLQNSPVQKYLDFKGLKYSYVKHLEAQGYSLKSVLQEINITADVSYYTFSIAGLTDTRIDKSPLDFVALKEDHGFIELQKVKEQISLLKNPEEIDYLMEAIKCFEAGSLRAGIIMTWLCAIRNIQRDLLKQSVTNLNESLKKFYPNAKTVKNMDDFSYINDSTLLKSAHDLNIYDRSQNRVLEQCLTLRNACSHPGKYRPTNAKVNAFLEDLVLIVFGIE